MTLRQGQGHLTVAEFARVSHTTPRTIRWYEKKRLLKPVMVDEWNKYRYFSPDQALTVFRIKLLQQLGLPLREIRAKLVSRKIASLDKELTELELFIRQKQRELRLLKDINALVFAEGDVKQFLRREQIGPYRLLCVRHEAGDYYKIDDYIADIRALAKQLKLKVKGSEITFYLDTKLVYKPKTSPLEITLILKKPPKTFPKALPPTYYVRELPKATVLSYSFQGPYIYLPLIYKKLDAYILEKKIKLMGPTFEQYVKNPLNTESEYDYVTKICYPIANLTE